MHSGREFAFPLRRRIRHRVLPLELFQSSLSLPYCINPFMYLCKLRHRVLRENQRARASRRFPGLAISCRRIRYAVLHELIKHRSSAHEPRDMRSLQGAILRFSFKFGADQVGPIVEHPLIAVFSGVSLQLREFGDRNVCIIVD